MIPAMFPAMTPQTSLPSRCAPLLALVTAVLVGCTNPAPAQTPEATAAPTTPADPAGDEGANFASPPQAAQEPPAEPAPPDDPQLAARVQEKFGDGCRLERVCGDLAGVDCNSAADGPYYYVRKADLETVSTCGGACRRGCTECPPPTWSCATY